MKNSFDNNFEDDISYEDDFSDSNFRDAYNIAIRIIAFSPQLSTVLREKMKKKGVEREIIDRIINKLKDNEILDDEKLLAQYVLSLSEKCYGRHEVINRIIAKGIRREIAIEIVDSIYIEDFELPLIEKFIQKKTRDLMRYYNERQYDYIKRKLYDRGFTSRSINIFFNSYDIDKLFS